MPSTPRSKATVYAEIDPALKSQFSDFADSRSSTFTEQLVLAMRRHLAYPPDDALTPIPAGKKSLKKREKSANMP